MQQPIEQRRRHHLVARRTSGQSFTALFVVMIVLPFWYR